MARSNAAEKQPAPEHGAKIERPDAGKQEAPESRAEKSSMGQVFELHLPGGGKLELRGAGKVEIAGLDQTVSIAKGEQGPIALVAPEAEAPAREKAADTMNRMLDVYDEAVESVAKAKGLEGSEKDAWIASMRDRKIEMVTTAMGEENPEGNLVSSLKTESGLAELERSNLADLKSKHREAKQTADAAYKAVSKNETAATVAAYEQAIAEVYAVESQMTEMHKQMDPEATAQQIAERVQGLVGIETSGKSLEEVQTEIEALQKQMDEISSSQSAERMARIKELESGMRDIDAGKGGGKKEYQALDAERQELMAKEDEPTMKWSVLEAARDKLAAVLPWMETEARIKELEDEMREIDSGPSNDKTTEKYNLLREEYDELREQKEALEAFGAAPREQAENFDPRKTSLYQEYRAMFQSIDIAARAESFLKSAEKMVDIATSSLFKKAFEALTGDIRDGKIEYTPLIELNEEGEAIAIGGEMSAVPDTAEEAKFFDVGRYSTESLGDLIASGDIESAEDLKGWAGSFDNFKAFAENTGFSMSEYGLPDTFEDMLALSDQQVEKPQGFFAKLFRRQKKYDLSPRAKAFEILAQEMTRSGASVGQFKELRQSQADRQAKAEKSSKQNPFSTKV